MYQEETNSIQQPKGVLACLTSGFELVAQRPGLILPPLLLDLFLWLGPRLAIPFNPQILAEIVQQMDVQNISVSQIADFWEHYNLFFTLSAVPVFHLPSLAVQKLFWEAPLARITLTLNSDLSLIAAFVMLLLTGIFLSSVYLRLIALTVIEKLELPLPGPQGVLAMTGRLLGLAALELPFILAGSGLIILFVSNGIPQGLGLFLLSAVFFLGLYLGLHLILAVPGLFMAERRTGTALRDIVLLVQVDFLGVISLYTLNFVLYHGLNILWTAPSSASWLQLVGLGGHAFIATGLTTTLFVFYANRLAYIRALRQAFAAMQARVSATRHS